LHIFKLAELQDNFESFIILFFSSDRAFTVTFPIAFGTKSTHINILSVLFAQVNSQHYSVLQALNFQETTTHLNLRRLRFLSILIFCEWHQILLFTVHLSNRCPMSLNNRIQMSTSWSES